MAKKSTITIKIRDGQLTAEGHNFTEKSCKDKMKFLQKVGKLQRTEEKGPTPPEPGPHINIHRS